MEIESTLYDKMPTEIEREDDFGNFKLLKTTAYANIYHIRVFEELLSAVGYLHKKGIHTTT